jgi:putative redox protein
MEKVTASIKKEHYKTSLHFDKHLIFADEPENVGGADSAPTPKELLISALGACTAITLRMYADKKGWNLEEAKVNLNIEFDKTNNKTNIQREVILKGELSEEQCQRLLQVANACPVHKILTNPIEVLTSLGE